MKFILKRKKRVIVTHLSVHSRRKKKCIRVQNYLEGLGSPASIASPSTPPRFEAPVSHAENFRPSSGVGAFKVPSISVATPSGGGSNIVHYPSSTSPATAHHQQMFQHLRPSVGKDARDSKIPLSCRSQFNKA